MSLDSLRDLAAQERLAVFGAFHSTDDDAPGKGTIVLLGPDEPGFWAHVTAAPEFHDGAPDPLDRWSHRVVTALAGRLGGTPLFPFGTPVHPFMSWALRSGRAWSSPVRLLVHERAGLMVSYRGAIHLTAQLPLEPRPARPPCDDCTARPCLGACPVGALTGAGYDLDTCHAYLDGRPDCMRAGCAVRRACPISESYGRTEAQSAFHMEHFHR